MPFLPTLATAVVLAAASVLCPSSQPSPQGVTRMMPLSGGPSLAFADPLRPLAGPAPWRPATLAFAELTPLLPAEAEPATTAALPARARIRSAVSPLRAKARVVTAGRRPCPGRACPESPFAPAEPSAGLPTSDPSSSAEEATPAALPFTATVAEVVGPVAREVGAGFGAGLNRLRGRAGDLVRGGQTVVKGSVAVLSDRLL